MKNTNKIIELVNQGFIVITVKDTELIMTEKEFIKAKVNNSLAELFKPIINFSGDAAFSGDNWYVHVHHSKAPMNGHYTVNIKPKTEKSKCGGKVYFVPGISEASMEQIYKHIENDVRNRKAA